jgi:hypothetical protein
MYPLGNRFNYVAQSMQYEALRVYLKMDGKTMALRQLDLMQIIINPESAGHGRTTDEVFETDVVGGTKKENKKKKKKCTFEEMTASFGDDLRSTTSKKEYERCARARIPSAENTGTYT